MPKKLTDKELYCRDKQGVIVINRTFLNSAAYLSLNTRQQALIRLLHEQWRMYKPVSYGVREASKKSHCHPDTAGKDFYVLQDRGLIVRAAPESFNSHSGSLARDWYLTWLPYDGKIPTNEWRDWTNLGVKNGSLKLIRVS